MKSPAQRQHGIVAILDAIGAASYSDSEIESFFQSRSKVLALLDEKIEGLAPSLGKERVHVFTFNDTIVIAYVSDQTEPTLEEIHSVFRILRKFLVDSLSRRILFRGSIAIGSFFVDDRSNTVMGQAVTDAAAWYDKAEWFGVHATPRATMRIQRWLESGGVGTRRVMIDYDVPIKGGHTVSVKAVNWPTSLATINVSPKAELLRLLSANSVPLGTESKYYNTLAFFEAGVAREQRGVSRGSVHGGTSGGGVVPKPKH